MTGADQGRTGAGRQTNRSDYETGNRRSLSRLIDSHLADPQGHGERLQGRNS